MKKSQTPDWVNRIIMWLVKLYAFGLLFALAWTAWNDPETNWMCTFLMCVLAAGILLQD